MRPKADLHTHTVASGHGYSTVAELAGSARARGLELIAITDHGPGCPGGAHPYHFWNLKALPAVLGGVRLLKGVEANVTDSDNGLDLSDELLEVLDLVAVGFHPESGFDDADEARNTEALLRAMRNPLVDMVTHPGNGNYPVDMDAIVACALERNVILELNDFTFAGVGSRKGSEAREREFAHAASAAGVRVAINSDAHFHLHVGMLTEALQVAEEIGLAEENVVNLDADTVLAYLLSRRPRPRLEVGGIW